MVSVSAKKVFKKISCLCTFNQSELENDREGLERQGGICWEGLEHGRLERKSEENMLVLA